MSYEIGKVCPSYVDKEGIITFSCETVDFKEIKIYKKATSSTPKYTMTVEDSAYYSRALFFHRSWTGNQLDNVSRPVIYIPNNVSEDENTGSSDASPKGISCTPLYECIFPAIGINASGNAQLTWWSNTKEIITANDQGKYLYDSSKIQKFFANDYSSVELKLGVSKILCSAPVYWERLKFDKYDENPHRSPVIRNISIIKCINNEGYVLDFVSEGSDGGSMRLHSHTNTMDGGFAAAVFMPSAVPRPMSWM